jgi:hypothetical protein
VYIEKQEKPYIWVLEAWNITALLNPGSFGLGAIPSGGFLHLFYYGLNSSDGLNSKRGESRRPALASSPGEAPQARRAPPSAGEYERNTKKVFDHGSKLFHSS